MKNQLLIQSALELCISKIEQLENLKESSASQGNWNVVKVVKSDLARLYGKKALLEWVLDSETADMPKL